jgi:hypothetical protein
MSSASIQAHSWDRHSRSVTAIIGAIRGLDTELRGIARNPQLQPGDRQRAEREARSKAEQTIRAARAALVQAVEEDRRAAVYADQPDAAAVARRSYYAGQARADLDGRRGDEALTLCRLVAASGDRERLAEYVRVARPALQQAGKASDLGALQRAAMPDEEKQHRAFGKAVESVEFNLPWLDKHVSDLLPQAGRLSEAQVKGWEPEPPELEPRAVFLWGDRVRREAVVAGARARAELDGVEPPAWARPERRDDPAPAAEADGAGGAAGEAS